MTEVPPSSRRDAARPGPRVAYVTTAFPWRSETAVIKELFELRRQGFDLSVISLKRSSFDGIFDPKANAFRDRTWYPSAGFLLRSLLLAAWDLMTRPRFRAVLGTTLRGSGRHLAKNLFILSMVPELARRVRAAGTDYIHANFSSFQGFAAWAIHRVTAIPFGFTVHAHDIFLDHFLMREKVADASLVVSISEYNVRYMEENFGIDPHRICVIRCGVDLDEFHPAAAPPESPPLILSVGRLHPMKGFDTLLDACRRLAGGPAFRCAIVGSGEERAFLEGRAHELGLVGRVTFHTGVPQSELIQMYHRCDLYVQPCRRAPDGQQDGIPATLMEAMAVAKPVISTRISGIPELIEHEREGLLVDVDDDAGLAQAIATLLGDRSRRQAMGAAARRKVERDFDAAANARSVGEAIRRVLADARGTGA